MENETSISLGGTTNFTRSLGQIHKIVRKGLKENGNQVNGDYFNLYIQKVLKIVGTQSYRMFSLHRPEETPMRPRPIIIGGW